MSVSSLRKLYEKEPIIQGVNVNSFFEEITDNTGV
jgi:hypothetical protein